MKTEFDKLNEALTELRIEYVRAIYNMYKTLFACVGIDLDESIVWVAGCACFVATSYLVLSLLKTIRVL